MGYAKNGDAHLSVTVKRNGDDKTASKMRRISPAMGMRSMEAISGVGL